MTTVYVKYDDRCSYGDVDPNDSWDRPNEYHSIRLAGQGYLSPPAYPFDQIDTDEEINPGVDVWDYFPISWNVAYAAMDNWENRGGDW